MQATGTMIRIYLAAAIGLALVAQGKPVANAAPAKGPLRVHPENRGVVYLWARLISDETLIDHALVQRRCVVFDYANLGQPSTLRVGAPREVRGVEGR